MINHFYGHQKAVVRDNLVIAVLSFSDHVDNADVEYSEDYDVVVDLCSIDKDAFISILRATPLENRVIEYNSNPSVVLTTQSSEHPFVVQSVSRGASSFQISAWYGDGVDWRRRGGNGDFSSDPEVYKSIFRYLSQTGVTFSDRQLVDGLKTMSRRVYNPRGIVKAIISAEVPMAADSTFKPIIYQDKPYIVNTQSPRNSYTASETTGKLVSANIPSSTAARMLGTTAPATIAQATGRRGRPAGQPNTPRPAAAPAAAGDINVREVMTDTGLDVAFLRLPRNILRKLNVTNARRVDPNGDRGVARRNNILGDRGRVGRTIAVGNSKIYFLSLPGGRILASINVQPGNSNYLLLPNENGNAAIALSSPSELLSVLQQRGLAEHHNYLVREFMANYPEYNNEVKNILEKHLNK